MCPNVGTPPDFQVCILIEVPRLRSGIGQRPLAAFSFYIMEIGKRPQRLQAVILLLVLLISITPFLLNLHLFRRLFWFGDELYLLSELRHKSFSAWSLDTFAENFVPLFKLAWGGLVYFFDGNYFGLVVTVWCTHLCNVGLLYLLMLRLGAAPLSGALAALTLGVSWSNIETLGWTVQWSAVLAISFFLLTAYVFLLSWDTPEDNRVRRIIMVFLICLAGVLSFSKGVINGLSLFAYGLLCAWVLPRGRAVFLGFTAAAIIPSVFVGLIIYFNAAGNHHSVLQSEAVTLLHMAEYALYYFCCNPCARLFGLEIPAEGSLSLLFSLGALKLFFVYYAFLAARRAANSKRLLFFCLLVIVDCLTSGIIGIARFHEGIASAVSSRYQYSSLVSFAPCFAFTIEAWLRRVTAIRPRAAAPMLLAGTAMWIALIAWPWRAQMRDWSQWRGTQGRALFFKGKLDEQRPPQYGPWIGLPKMLSTEEAHATIEEFNLH